MIGETKEKGCVWSFGPEGGADNGPTNPTKGTFRSLPDINVVREAIQNSLDVPLAPTKPVLVKFSFSRLSSADFPNFFAIRRHIEASLEFYKDTDRAQEKFPRMIRFLSRDDSLREYADDIGVLTISDFNTSGMSYRKDDRMCSFYAFFHSVGVSVCKGENSGGSNGLGKETLYNRSVIKSLILSTRNKDGDVVFQGAAKLTTHLDPDSGRKVSAFGFYGRADGEPVVEEDAIPELFRRNEPGTDIHVVGIEQDDIDGMRKSLVEAVLNHFWLAVHREKLVVEVDGIRIDRQTLGGLIDKHFKDNKETQTARYEKWNPRPYYHAILNVEAHKEKSAFVETEFPVIGSCRLYLDWSTDDLPRRISYMRQPRMVIFKKAFRSYPSFVGVFVCNNDVGNRVLRCVEPPAHDEWNLEHYEGSERQKHRDGIEEVRKFVQAMLEKYLRPQSLYNEIVIPGLAELLPDTDERTQGGERGTVGSGASDGLQPSGHLATKETGSPVSVISEENGETKSRSSGASSLGEASGLVDDTAKTNDESADVDQTTGTPSNDASGGTSGGSGNDPNSSRTSTSHTTPKENSAVCKIVKVLLRVMLVMKDGVRWHRLVVRPVPSGKKGDYANVTLRIKTGNDNNSSDGTPVREAAGLPSGAVQSGNDVSNLDMRDGVKFDVRFEDSLVHSVKVVAYARA